jgi:hypothetical protein
LVAENVPAESEPGDKAPRLARRSPFAPVTKLCPRCLNPLQTVLGLPGMTPPSYFCSKCGYAGTVYLEKELGGEKGT